MSVRSILMAIAASFVVACPPLEHSSIDKRQNLNISSSDRFWAYTASFDWARLNPEWALCQTGTQQAPIPLRLDQGLSQYHQMTFNYPANVTGDFYNWGYGPAYTVDRPTNNYTSLPNMTFSDSGVNETVYLAGWHIHTPADHTVQGARSRAELHYVHADATGKYRAVLAFRIDPGNANSEFFNQLPPYVGFNETSQHDRGTTLDIQHALREVNNFSDFWTYRGSLTSPPCTEGVRWFVARNILFVSDEQLEAMLGASTYSARAEQQVWRHDINV